MLGWLRSQRDCEAAGWAASVSVPEARLQQLHGVLLRTFYLCHSQFPAL